MKTIRRPISILLAVLMVVGMFTVLPITASAAPPESGSSGSMETGTTITPSAAKWTFKLNSNFSGEWNADTDVVSEQPVELNLAAGDYEFQIIANDGTTTFYRGNEQAGSSTETYSQVMHDNGGNAKFHADGGKYTLTYNSGTGVLTINPVYVAEIDGTNYKTLEAAFAAAQDGATITLLANCAGNGIKVPQGKFANSGLTVDFAGFTYTVDGETVGSTGTETNGFQLLKNNNINFLNGTIYSEKAKILVQNYSNLGLYGMTLTLNNTSYNGAYTLSNNNGNAGIHNTTINANPTPGSFAFDVCRFNSYPSVNVEVTGESEINGNVEIFASKGDPKYGFSLTLSGGTLNGDIVVDSTAQTAIENYPEKAVVTKANTFTQTAPEGFEWVDNGQGGSTLVALPYAAKIGDTKYRTLEEAFAAAQDGDTITLLADSTGNGIKVPTGKFATGLTVDFDDNTYTIDGETVGSTGTETNGFQLLKDNNITFKNGTITSEKAKILVQNYSDLTLLGMTLTLDNPNYTSAYTLSNNNGDVVIDSTTINANPKGGFAFDVCRFSSYPFVHVTVKGGSDIQGDVEISASKGDAKQGFSLTLEGGSMTGSIVVDASAQALVGEVNKVTKADTFNKTAPEGFKWVSNEDGTASLAPIPYVAQIDETKKYETLAEAFAAAEDGDTITLLADCAGDGIKVAKAKFANGLTVDFNGHTYTVDGETVGSSGTETIGFQLLKGNKITFQNGTITGNSNTNQTLQRMIQNYSDLTLYNMTVSMVGRYKNQITVSTCNGKTVIKDSKISAPDFTWAGYDDPAEVGAAALAVGTFSSYPSIDVTVEDNSTINGDVNVTDDNNKKAFSLTLNGGELNGKINLDENAKAAIDDTESTANVTKADSFTQKAPEGYKWVDNGDGTSTLAVANYVAQVGETKYESLEEAVAAAPAGATVTLLADIDYSEIYTVRNARDTGDAHSIDLKDLTLDLNDNTISAINGTVTFGGNGATIKNGTFALVPKNTDGSYKDGSYALFVDNVPLGYPTTATVNIEDVVCEGAVNLSGVTAELTDVTASTTPTKFYTVWAENGANVTINSGTYTDAQPKGKGNLGVGASDTESVIYVKGGNFNATVRNVYSKTPAGSVQISGGTFTKPVLDEYCAEGFVPKDNGDGTYTVGGPYAAIIGDTGYATLEAAFAAAVDGDTIKVLADCSGNGIKVLKNTFKTKGLTVDFDGHTYTMDGATVGSSGTETQAFQLQYNNKITFKNGTLYSEKALFLVQNYSNLTLDGMTLTLNNQNYAYGYTLSNNYGNTVIKDTTINANPAGKFAFDVCRGGGSNSYKYVHVTVTGNSFINGDVEVDARNGDPRDGFSLNLESGTLTGDIKLTANAETAIDNKPDKASVNKQNTFTHDPAEGYKWVDNGDGTSTLVKIPKLFTGHNITLRGDVSLNFFINTAAIENYDPSVPAKVVFTYDGTRTAEVAFADATPASDGVIVATIQVPAAFMAHKIKAVVYYNGAAQAETDEYSIQQYAETLIADPAAYGIPAAKVEAVKTLMKEMLNYGAKAQTVFAGQVKEQAAYDDLTEKYDYHMASVTDADIQAAIDAAPQNAGKTATDLSTVKPEANATFYTASVVFLSESTLKIVFKVPGGSTITGYDGSQKNTYYWVQEKDIAAAQLDTLQEFTVGDATFYYSALDYAKVVLKNGNAAAQDLVSALYLYNQAANGYFGANA